MSLRHDYKDASNAGAWIAGFRQGEAVGRGQAQDAIKAAREAGCVLGLISGALFVAIVIGIWLGVTA